MRTRLLFAAFLTAVAPIALAPAANATTTTTWDRVAQCESGGNWHINTGNGYYGGLQIARQTWSSFGGTHYASLPNQASKPQQITVATRILKGQGRGAWGYCGNRAGL